MISKKYLHFDLFFLILTRRENEVQTNIIDDHQNDTTSITIHSNESESAMSHLIT